MELDKDTIKQLEEQSFLIVDDYGSYRRMLGSMLKEYNVEDITDVASGKKAILEMAKRKFDVVLCDYNLGDGKDGQQILEEARIRNIIGDKILFIMITAETSIEMVMGAIEYKPDDYLIKPFTKELLWKRIQRNLKKKQALLNVYHLSDQKKYKDALKACDKALADAPNYAIDIAKIKSTLLMNLKKYKSAEKLYGKVLKIRELPWAQLGLAKVHIANKNYMVAKEILEKLTMRFKEYVEAYDLLAEIFRLMDDTDRARDVLAVAAKISPKTIARQKILGALALQSNDMETAEKAFKAAVKSGKNSYLKSASDYVGLAKVYVKKGMGDKALETIKNAQDDNELKEDKDGIFHTKLIEAQIAKDSGRDHDAMILFDKLKHESAIRGTPLPNEIAVDMVEAGIKFNDKKIVRKLMDQLDHSVDHDQADYLRQQVEDHPDTRKEADFMQLNKAGMSLYQRGKIDKAIEMFEQAAENLPDNIHINMNAAQAILQLIKKHGRSATMLEDARHYLDQAKAKDATNAKYIELEAMYEELEKEHKLTVSVKGSEIGLP